MSIRVVGSIQNTVNMSMELHFRQSFVPLRNPIKPTNWGLSLFRNISASAGESWGSPAVIPFPAINQPLRWKKIRANWRAQQFEWIVVAVRVSSYSRNRAMWIFSSPLGIWNLLRNRTGARGAAVGWGTALQVGRSQVRFPIVSL
jgi:hypothetical protein